MNYIYPLIKPGKSSTTERKEITSIWRRGDLTLSMNRCTSDTCMRKGHEFRE